MRSESGRDATEKRARVGGLPNPNRSKRERARPIRMDMGSKESLPGGRRSMRRLKGGKPERAKLVP